MHQGVGKSTAWILTAQMGQLTGMLLFGQFSDRIGRRPAYTTYSLITAVALGGLAFSWQHLSTHPGQFWATMLTLGVGSGCTAGFGALLAELFPTEIRGFAMGTTYNCARAVQALAPILVQMAVDHNGLEGGLIVPFTLALATAVWVWVLPETRAIVLPTIIMDKSVIAALEKEKSTSSIGGGGGASRETDDHAMKQDGGRSSSSGYSWQASSTTTSIAAVTKG